MQRDETKPLTPAEIDEQKREAERLARADRMFGLDGDIRQSETRMRELGIWRGTTYSVGDDPEAQPD